MQTVLCGGLGGHSICWAWPPESCVCLQATKALKRLRKDCSFDKNVPTSDSQSLVTSNYDYAFGQRGGFVAVAQ